MPSVETVDKYTAREVRVECPGGHRNEVDAMHLSLKEKELKKMYDAT